MNEKEKLYENIDLPPDIGFDIHFVTMDHNSPLHWHRALEILFILNGHATVMMDGMRHELEPLDVIVMDYSRIHEVRYALPQTMGMRIHISRQLIKRYMAGTELLRIRCSSDSIAPDKQDAYEELRRYLKEITVLYMNQKRTYPMRSSGLILEILANLIEHFSETLSKGVTEDGGSNMERLERICEYVEQHHAEAISLQDAADALGLNREYFCRFFKQRTGISFIKYVNQVRIGHIYQELLHTEDSIQLIIERHGFRSQKLFYRMLKEKYGCTPRELRRMGRNNPLLSET